MGRRLDIRELPPVARLNEIFTYDKRTGDLRWRSIPHNFRRAKVGDVAGTINSRGYRVVGIDREYFFAHRIIWKMVTGADPLDLIDHKDGNRTNNAWRNLRGAANGQNIQNSKLRADNKSGFKGVCWDASHNAWLASIAVNGRQIKLGRFKNKDAAAAARAAAEANLHGQYARAA